MSDLQERVARFIQAHHLLAAGQRVVVGVSGGPDSVCLLHLLWSLREELGVELRAAHLHHGLRPEAGEEAQYVAQLCQRLEIPVSMERRDVAGYRRLHRLSGEEAAREVRYSFLFDITAAQGARTVAVGHTADDQVETILLHLLRGSGLRGLVGMRPLSRRNGVSLVRPLLETTRKETEAYCAAHQLQPRYDSSNLSTAFLRNRLRLQLIPLLESLNPQFRASLLRLARHLAQDLAFMEAEGARAWGEVVSREGEGLSLDLSRFKRLPPSLQHQLLMRAAEEMGVSLEGIHIENMLSTLEGAGKRLVLPRGLGWWLGYGQAWLGFSPPPCPFPALKGEYSLTVPGESLLPGWRVRIELGPTPLPLEGKGFTTCLDAPETGRELWVRARRRGDRFQPLGMGAEKRLQDFMVDAHIPHPWRERVPLLCSHRGILWVVGWRIDERAKLTPQSQEALKIEFQLA